MPKPWAISQTAYFHSIGKPDDSVCPEETFHVTIWNEVEDSENLKDYNKWKFLTKLRRPGRYYQNTQGTSFTVQFFS